MGTAYYPPPSAGMLAGAHLWFNNDSDPVGSSEVTITENVGHTPFVLNVATPKDRLWVVTFVCKRWDWTNTSSEPLTNPWWFIKPSGSAAPTPATQEFESPNVGSASVVTDQFMGMTLTGLFRATAAGTATFTARAWNSNAGVSSIKMEGPLLFSAVDGGPLT